MNGRAMVGISRLFQTGVAGLEGCKNHRLVLPPIPVFYAKSPAS